MIEIRGGMHPELTGRENTYVYGTLLGLGGARCSSASTRSSSSPTWPRHRPAVEVLLLRHADAARLRGGRVPAPDVLLVDEVLAVGDAWFQQRCLDRMRAVLQEGTTLVFVSHDLASVEAMCRRGLWLDNGVLIADGPIREVLSTTSAAFGDMNRDGRLDLVGGALRGGPATAPRRTCWEDGKPKSSAVPRSTGPSAPRST